MNILKEKREKGFILSMAVFTLVLFIRYYGQGVNSYNATIFALNYKYGFVSRGLVGSIYALLNRILPWDIMNYSCIFTFCKIVTALFFIFLMAFCERMIMRAQEGYHNTVRYLVLYLLMLLVSSFSCIANFGRVDLYLITASLISVWLLVVEKCEWLVIPLSIMAVMVHQGYVFMYFNLILVLLLYKMLTIPQDAKEGQILEIPGCHIRCRKKYLILFLVDFLLVSALFLYFEFFSKSGGESIYGDVVAMAKQLAPDGDYHEGLLQAEVLGVDLSASEWGYHKRNFLEIVIFCLLFSPYIVLIGNFFKSIIKMAEDKAAKLKYILCAFGGFTMLPCYIMKCDYGRWVIATLVYYIVIIMALIAVNDETAVLQARKVTALKGEHQIVGMILLIYPLLFMPMWDVTLGPVISTISDRINVYIWNLW